MLCKKKDKLVQWGFFFLEIIFSSTPSREYGFEESHLIFQTTIITNAINTT